ncbi:MAG: BACON domain-containing protein [Bacteroides sp.]|nr:BACON domain-containing protein [Bacteroides sp.]
MAESYSNKRSFLRHSLLLATYLIIAVVYSACGGDTSPLNEDPSNGDDGIVLSLDTLVVDAQGATEKSIKLKFNTVSSFFAKSDQAWCVIKNPDGSGKSEYNVLLDIEENKTTEDRVAKISFHSGEYTKYAYVAQQGVEKKDEPQDNNEYQITIDPDSCNYSHDGGTEYFVVYVDKATTISIKSDADWCIIGDDYNESYYNTPSTAFKLAIQVNSNIDGVRTATVTVRAGKSTATCTITQDAYITGENKIGGTIAEAVDLGLSVKWASHNLGATKETEAGAYLGWGLLDKSKYYNEDYHPYYNNNYEMYKDIGTNISRTKYDAAFYHWGDNWRMPTKAECDELLKKCEWQWTQVNRVNGYRVTGPNGKQIFLPAWGYQANSYDSSPENKYINLWTGEVNAPHDKSAIYFGGDSSGKWTGYLIRCWGLNIRPVK